MKCNESIPQQPRDRRTGGEPDPTRSGAPAPAGVPSFALTKLRAPHLFARRLLDISPHSPLAIPALIEHDWNFAQPR